MGQITEHVTYSEKPLPAVYAAALEFHLLIQAHLDKVEVRAAQAGPINRATERACEQIFLASHSGPKPHLRTAKKALLKCMHALQVLRAHGTLTVQFCSESERRIDQLLIGIDQLEGTATHSWPEQPFSPQPALLTDEPSVSSKRIEPILERVSKAIALHARAKPRAARPSARALTTTRMGLTTVAQRRRQAESVRTETDAARRS